MKYRLKPRFYVITITAGLLISGFAIQHIDATCSEKIESGEIIKPATMVYAQEIEEPMEPEQVSLGEYKITHYCSCPTCCGVWAENRPVDENGQEIVLTASGARAEAGKTIAVDPDVIPLGSTVIINDQEYVAQDTGGAIQGNRIDIYCGSHEEALQLGVITAEVYMEG
jgi:3D (Asp-Asp-Asp) domain-containing protein